MINIFKNVKFHYLLLGFFILVIVINIAYIFIAKKTWRGRVVDQKIIYKSAGQVVFEEKKITNFVVAIIHRELGDNRWHFNLTVRDRAGSLIRNAQAFLDFKKSSSGHPAFLQQLEYNDSSSTYSKDFEVSGVGEWEVKISIRTAEGLFEEVKKINLVSNLALEVKDDKNVDKK